MLTTHKVYVERIEKFLSPLYWTNVNIHSVLYYDTSKTITSTIFVHEPESTKSPKFIEIIDSEYIPTTIGKSFGPSWTTKWFKVIVTLNQAIKYDKDKLMYAFQWDSDSEALLYDSEGKILQAYTGGNGCDRRDLYIFSANIFNDTDVLTFYVEMACNGMFGNGNNGMIQPPDENRYFTLKKANIVGINKVAWDLYWDMTTLHDIANGLKESDPIAVKAAILGNKILNNVDLSSIDSMNTARKLVKLELLQFNDSDNESVIVSCKSKLDHDVYCVGHCHIDTAWLWTYKETRRKIARSWVTQYHLLCQFSDIKWKFVASQAIHWEWLKSDYPDLYYQIIEKVKDNHFVGIGGSYVEFDANLPSGDDCC